MKPYTDLDVQLRLLKEETFKVFLQAKKEFEQGSITASTRGNKCLPKKKFTK